LRNSLQGRHPFRPQNREVVQCFTISQALPKLIYVAPARFCRITARTYARALRRRPR
jgi:hypothetical protein